MRKNIKEEIIEATIQLIEEKGSDTDSITISEICSRVKVGVGLVNYHFQTKENLIRQCVQTMIGRVITQTRPLHASLAAMSNEDKLRAMLKSTATFLAANENLSRISIQTDLENDQLQDNTRQTADAYWPIFRAAVPAEMDEREARRRLYMIIFSIQAVFMRRKLYQMETGIDYTDKTQRDKLVDDVVDRALK
ncbi:MAG: TetR/AcrR family transcriptional regulator [Anaerolineae bacterium]|nr:TetR/AcrR family transcriptional regulator [Anaerolineae bacterium]